MSYTFKCIRSAGKFYCEKFYQILHSSHQLLRGKKIIHTFLNQGMLGEHRKCILKHEACNGGTKEHRTETKP